MRSRLLAVLVVAAALIATAALAVGSAAADSPGQVKLTGTYAGPISAADPRCTPEPAGRTEYGTQVPFNPSVAISAPSALGSGYPGSDTDTPSTPYVPANVPTVDDLHPALQAGASNDLCVGFTLTPNMEPDFILNASNPNGQRLQATPPLPNVPDTNVVAADGVTPVVGDDMHNIKIDLPEGFQGTPDSTPQCSASAFGAGNYLPVACDADPAAPKTQVGTVFLRASVYLAGAGDIKLQVAYGGSPNDTSGKLLGGRVYNLAHSPNELGLLGVEVQPATGVAPAKFTVRLLLDPDGSGRIEAVATAPQALYLKSDINASTGQPNPGAEQQPLYVESVGIRAWGSKADHPTLASDFAQWGTDCTTPLSSDISIDTYNGVHSAMTSSPFHLTGCDQLAPFKPTLDVTTTSTKAASPTGVTVDLKLPQSTGSDPLTPLLKDASVTLPQGLELGAQVASGASGLPLCTDGQFGANSQAADQCPAGSQVGTVNIVSPLQTLPFQGKVFLGPQTAVGALPKLFVEAAEPGATAVDAPRIKLVGTETVSSTGQLTTTFTNAPQLRFSELKLTFPAGDHALFTTPRTCGTATSTSQLTSSASAAPVVVSSSINVSDCTPVPFSPTFSMIPADPSVGASSPTTITISRQDGSAWLTGINVALPSGFLANLNNASTCGAADAATGNCPDSSRIATVTTTAGVGSQPLSLGGEMYLTDPQPGQVAGAVIVVDAKLGELDLGNVVVPAQIALRPTDAGLTLVATTPTRFQGLALNLQSITVALDRTGFPLNPTACGPLGASAQITGDDGSVATPTTQVSYLGCAARPFKPTLTGSLVGALTTNAHPTVQVSIATRPGDSNLKSTTVTLPTGVSSDPKNLQVTCPQASFDANACPANTHVGTVSANVSITNDTIGGDIYLVHVPGQGLPGLGLSFTGRYAQRLVSTVQIGPNGRLITSFASIPDLPLTKLTLTIAGGKASPIEVNSEVCASPGTWDVSYTGQGGQSYKSNQAFDCSTPKPAVKWSLKKGLSLVFTSPAGKTLKSAKITLPSGFKLKHDKKSLKKYTKVTAKGGKDKVKYTGAGISITGTGAGPTKITVAVKANGLTLSKSVKKKGFKKGKKFKLKTRVGLSNGSTSSVTTSVKLAK